LLDFSLIRNKFVNFSQENTICTFFCITFVFFHAFSARSARTISSFPLQKRKTSINFPYQGSLCFCFRLPNAEKAEDTSSAFS